MERLLPTSTLEVSQDAAIVLALARTAVPFVTSTEEEAERWLRVLRMHGQVGCALQALGVGEAPLETPAGEPSRRRHGRRFTDMVEEVTSRAFSFARRRSARAVGTVDVLFAVLYLYGGAFDRELYRRGTSRDELLVRLPTLPALELIES
ncbi:MAG: hypothetical protein M3N16_01080 [Actinomycetota bacterium]|nr:hypothetical protein [Actinomycetota bacterium]